MRDRARCLSEHQALPPIRTVGSCARRGATTQNIEYRQVPISVSIEITQSFPTRRRYGELCGVRRNYFRTSGKYLLRSRGAASYVRIELRCCHGDTSGTHYSLHFQSIAPRHVPCMRARYIHVMYGVAMFEEQHMSMVFRRRCGSISSTPEACVRSDRVHGGALPNLPISCDCGNYDEIGHTASCRVE